MPSVAAVLSCFVEDERVDQSSVGLSCALDSSDPAISSSRMQTRQYFV